MIFATGVVVVCAEGSELFIVYLLYYRQKICISEFYKLLMLLFQWDLITPEEGTRGLLVYIKEA